MWLNFIFSISNYILASAITKHSSSNCSSSKGYYVLCTRNAPKIQANWGLQLKKSTVKIVLHSLCMYCTCSVNKLKKKQANSGYSEDYTLLQYVYKRVLLSGHTKGSAKLRRLVLFAAGVSILFQRALAMCW